jgi:hypothetical protein
MPPQPSQITQNFSLDSPVYCRVYSVAAGWARVLGDVLHFVSNQPGWTVFGLGSALLPLIATGAFAHTGHPHGAVEADTEPSKPTSDMMDASLTAPALSTPFAMDHPYHHVARSAAHLAEVVQFQSIQPAQNLDGGTGGWAQYGDRLGEVAFVLVVGSPILLYATRAQMTH